MKAVRAACVDEVNRMGFAWTDNAQRDLRETVEWSDRPRRIWRALAAAMIEAVDFCAALPPGESAGLPPPPWLPNQSRPKDTWRHTKPIEPSIGPNETPATNPYAEWLKGFVDECSFEQRTDLVSWRKLLPTDDNTGPEDLQKRTLLVRYNDHEGWWWWKGRKPTNRDLALLSLLAGDFPDSARKQQKEDPKNGPTASDVIEAEARAIGMARKRVAEWRAGGFLSRLAAEMNRAGLDVKITIAEPRRHNRPR